MPFVTPSQLSCHTVNGVRAPFSCPLPRPSTTPRAGPGCPFPALPFSDPALGPEEASLLPIFCFFFAGGGGLEGDEGSQAFKTTRLDDLISFPL